MAKINLVKGQKLNLTKDAPELTSMDVALGWNPSCAEGVEFDLDVSAFLCDANGKVVPNENIVYYNNLKSVCESVIHTGDNTTGEGEGDDETITVDLSKVPATVEKINFVITIHDATNRGQNFGQVNDAYVRLVNKTTNVEEIKFDLTEDHSVGTSVRVCEFYRHNGDWKFNAQGVSEVADLGEICRSFGIDA